MADDLEKRVNQVLDYCFTMQAMVEPALRSLRGLRNITDVGNRMQASLETTERNITIMFGKMLAQRGKVTFNKEVPKCLEDYPKIKQMLEVTGLPSSVAKGLIATGMNTSTLLFMPPDDLAAVLDGFSVTNAQITQVNRCLGRVHAWVEAHANGDINPEPSIPLGGGRNGSTLSSPSFIRPNSSTSSQSRSSNSSVSSFTDGHGSHSGTQTTVPGSPSPSSDGDVFDESIKFPQSVLGTPKGSMPGTPRGSSAGAMPQGSIAAQQQRDQSQSTEASATTKTSSRSFPTTPPPNRRVIVKRRTDSPVSDSQALELAPMWAKTPLSEPQLTGGNSLGVRNQHRFFTKLLIASKCHLCRNIIKSKGRQCSNCRAKYHKNCEKKVQQFTCPTSSPYLSHSHQSSPIQSRDSTLERLATTNLGGGVHMVGGFVSSTSSSSASTPSSVPYSGGHISAGSHTHFAFPSVSNVGGPYLRETSGRASPIAVSRRVNWIASSSSSPANFIDSVESNDSSVTVVGNDSVTSSLVGNVVQDSKLTNVEESNPSDEMSPEEVSVATLAAAMVRQTSLGHALQEWDIEYSELTLNSNPFKDTRSGPVYRAHWHGEVLVKMLPFDTVPGNEADKEELLALFKQEVATLKKVRHENLVLFMGACMRPPDLAVVTSALNGVTLYSAVRKMVISFDKKVAICSQVVQGMAYLHSKGIVHKDLTSRNIYLDKERVTIAEFGLSGVGQILLSKRRQLQKQMVSQEGEEKRAEAPEESESVDTFDCAQLKAPLSWLCYLAPELVRTLEAHTSWTDLPYSTESDVYAFGSVWFEIVTGDFPFAHADNSAAVIWQIGNGIKQTLYNLPVTKESKDILIKCWAFTPTLRPNFSELGDMLERVPKKKLSRSPSQPINSVRSYECGF